MWSRENALIADVDPERVWERWSVLEHWAEDDSDVVAAGLDGPVVAGTSGWVRPRGGPRMKVSIVRAIALERLDFEGRLPGALMRIEHEMTAWGEDEVRFVHRVRFSGPAARVWRRLIGTPIADGLPAVMANIARRAARPPVDPQNEPKKRGQGEDHHARDVNPWKGTIVPVSMNLDSLLDKAYENSSLGEILDAPVDALAGVSASDAEALKSAFNIKTVRDLGKNKYFAAAVALHDLSETGAK